MPKFLTLTLTLTGSSCACVVRQHHCDGLHQQARQTAVSSVAHVGSQTDRVEHLPSLRVTHVPGGWNCRADLLFRGSPLHGEWKFHRVVAIQIWMHYGHPTVDLYPFKENAQCPMFFSSRDLDISINALVHEWPQALYTVYAIPPLVLIPPTLAKVQEKPNVVQGNTGWQILGTPLVHGPAITGGVRDISSPFGLASSPTRG